MNAEGSAFVIALVQELMSSMNNWYGEDNWDPARFGPYRSSVGSAAITKLNAWLSGKIAIVPVEANKTRVASLSSLTSSLAALESVYTLLADDHSRSTLVKVLAYRLMGHKNVKLPLNTSSYWSAREGARSLVKSSRKIQVGFPEQELDHVALAPLGYPLELYLGAFGVVTMFMLKHYEYGKSDPVIRAEGGDCVIDAGGCWGDTALYFAHLAGETGRVYSFEFTQENLDVFQRNVDLNPGLSPRIEVVPRALWDSSDREIGYSPYGPGTTIAQAGQRRGGDAVVTTVSLDDFVRERSLPRVDFIKMDIEGAELNALKGAEKTLTAHRPRLAISVYHRASDFIDIPAYLNGLGLGYEFFLDHFTIYGEETVLFARSKEGGRSIA